MAVMKQISSCLNRAFNGQAPLKSSKWKGVMRWKEEQRKYYLYLYHYQHLVLVYDVKEHYYLFWWYEKPADKRGFESAVEWLENRRGEYDSIGTELGHRMEDCVE
jgi:hypothetical protein